jgi:hypothetical protein
MWAKRTIGVGDARSLSAAWPHSVTFSSVAPGLPGSLTKRPPPFPRGRLRCRCPRGPAARLAASIMPILQGSAAKRLLPFPRGRLRCRCPCVPAARLAVMFRQALQALWTQDFNRFHEGACGAAEASLMAAVGALSCEWRKLPGGAAGRLRAGANDVYGAIVFF